jgi:hypothetical protein
MTSLLAHSIWLSLVLCHSCVNGSVPVSFFGLLEARLECFNVLDNIWTNWGAENAWKGMGLIASLAIPADDTDSRSARHCGRYWESQTRR